MADNEEIAFEERIYTIPLRKVKNVARTRRAPVAMRVIEDYITRHMKPEIDGEVITDSKIAKGGKGDDKKLFIDPPVNRKIWERGIEKPPSRIRVRARKFEDGTVEVQLPE